MALEEMEVETVPLMLGETLKQREALGVRVKEGEAEKLPVGLPAALGVTLGVMEGVAAKDDAKGDPVMEGVVEVENETEELILFVKGSDVATALRVMVTLVEGEREGECEALLHRLGDGVSEGE